MVGIIRNDQLNALWGKWNMFPMESDNWTTKNSTAAKNEMLSFRYREEIRMYASYWIILGIPMWLEQRIREEWDMFSQSLEWDCDCEKILDIAYRKLECREYGLILLK